ncbi:hypothetical protein SKAU_G00418730 [Synaphobranchus kaupii]|uniref:Uncharacterized protein n=1 Tax=Synaphobranchus kaupii TaxID=118154 RepID=A0A9Q1E6B7_SYNKA|nr:hypothetical protein SKAU_G00418730 [Synaphobranchus kaupii]
MIEVKRFILIGCLLQASPPKPKLTPEKEEVMEGTSALQGERGGDNYATLQISTVTSSDYDVIRFKPILNEM